MTARLSEATLPRLPDSVARPAYDRRTVRTGVVHLGLGAFHRAHQAVAFDTLIAGGDPRWGVLGVSMRSTEVRDRLAPQDGLYTVSSRDPGGVADRVIGALTGVLVAPEAPQAVIEAIAGPDVRMLTLTVTEKGYTPGPASGPPTAAALIAEGLSLRRARGLGGVTIASCDNLGGNGRRLKAEVMAHAGTALSDWIDEAATFPDSMVDRMTPATTPDEIEAFRRRAGLTDRGLVVAEPFSQWVIEDRFAASRPDFESAGVQVVRNVDAWEAAKLRLLNGAHSMIAWNGALEGCRFVHEFVARPDGAARVRRLWAETAPTLPLTPGLDLGVYQNRLMQRLANPLLAHRLDQIAMDSSQKVFPRLLAPLAERMSRGADSPELSLAVASWIQWLIARAAADLPVDDPLAFDLGRAVQGSPEPLDQVRAILSLPGVCAGGQLSDALVLSVVAALAVDRRSR